MCGPFSFVAGVPAPFAYAEGQQAGWLLQSICLIGAFDPVLMSSMYFGGVPE